jgi:hypothetical protein
MVCMLAWITANEPDPIFGTSDFSDTSRRRENPDLPWQWKKIRSTVQLKELSPHAWAQ